MAHFAATYGYAVSVASYGPDTMGNAPNCNNLEGGDIRSGTGPAYMIVLSFWNLLEVSRAS